MEANGSDISAGLPLESVLRTEELNRRPARAPEYASESNALVSLAQVLADCPRMILQKLADTALDVFRAGSAGISLVSKDSGNFYWPAIAGAWRPHIGGGTPRNFGPCGVVLDRNAVQLFTHPELCYPYLAAASPIIEEVLLAPFYVKGMAVGTVWIVSHDANRRFDAEDQRLLVSLSTFAAAAFQTLESLDEIERRRAESDRSAEQLRKSREQIKLGRDLAEATLRTSPIPLLVLRDDLRVLTANEAFYQSFHVLPEQTEGCLIHELGNRQWDIPKLRELLEDILPSHKSFENFEVSHHFDRIGQRTVLLNARRMEVECGGPERIVVVIEDITERKLAGIGLDLAREAAENANRAKDRFLAVLSHELRTPLTPVLMSVVAMDMNPDLAPAVRGDIAMIRRNVELEAKLIDDLLDLSRITAGKLRLEMDAVDVNAAVRHACQTCRPLILEKAIHLHCNFLDEAAFVKVDSARLQQILWNLLRNAAKFTPENGDIHVDVAVSSADRNRVRIEVRDSGIGIAPQVLPKIFEAFEQGDPGITKQFGGMGLGLAISRALAELHGGSIRAQSDGSDKGSIFTVELPRLSRDQVPAPVIVPSRNTAERLRVLVVEDHRDSAEVLCRLLQASGHHVKTAYSAAAALELVDREVFDVLVSDIGLPDATGYELMSQIKTRYAIKGIAMSGYGMDEDLRKSREAGFDDHIVKPANVAQLERSIRRVAGGASVQQ